MPGPGARRAAFVLYAVPLFVATHWPALAVPVEGRWDLLVHAAVFAGWNALLIACGYFGPALSARNIKLATVIAAAYAAFDEGLQALPMVRRTAAWDDFGANLAGVTLAAVVAGVLAVRRNANSGAR